MAAYAVIVRGDRILLSRLAERLTPDELWTLPGGGIEHGEDPRDAVVREVHEETGLDVEVGDEVRVFSSHQPSAWRGGRRVDAWSVRIVYDGWVAPDAPAPEVQEVDGSTMEAAWKPLADVLDGTVPTVALVGEALAVHRPARLQRVSAHALVVDGDRVLLVRHSVRGPHPGTWSLPGGGIEHGESPRAAAAREVAEETGLVAEVGEVLDVADAHFEGTAPSGRHEDFHAVQLVFAAAVPPGSEPRVAEIDGTTDAVAWVPLAEVGSERYPVRELVTVALARRMR